MEVKQIVRKASAIAASASFIGASMLGAVAQDLANYPSPFVQDGTFDAFIVVGQNALPEDVVGAVDVGASLQFALKKETSSGSAAAEATISEGYKVEKSGNKFSYGDSVNSVEAAAIGEDELPLILGDGKFVESEGDNKNSETYTQELLFVDNTTAKLVFDQQEDDVDAKETAADYLLVDKGQELYNYTLEFDSPIDYNNATSTTANDDLKTATLTIQGQTYTITDVQLAGGVIDKITLLSGEAVLWLTQNNPITKTVSGVEHTIEVLDVTEAEDACQVKVDDTTAIIDEDETKTINGVQIGITDVRAIHAQLQDVDVCQVSVGATELELENGNRVKVDDEELEGSNAIILDTGAEFEGFVVQYDAGELDNDALLATGKEFIDPIFHSWKIVYGGLSANYETLSFDRQGSSDAEAKFTNNDGKAVSIPLFLNDSNNVVRFGDGDDVDEAFLAAGTGISGLSTECISASVTDCEGVKILAATVGGEAHVFEIVDIDLTDNETDIRDLTYGRTYSDVDFVRGTATNLDLGSYGSFGFNVGITGLNLTVSNTVQGRIETSNEATLNFTQSAVAVGANSTIVLEETTEISDEQALSSVSVLIKPDSNDEEIDFVASASGTLAANGVEAEDDSDYNIYVTNVGTKVTVNSEDDDSVKIEVPSEEVFGNVFIAPIVAEVQTASGGVGTYTLSRLNVGASKLDSEISDVSASNLIVVGGPCANKIAAQVLGKTYPACGADSGIESGTGIIKAVTQASGKVALVVAGYEAADTRRATRVLANYDKYDLSGSMVTVTGTSLTDIQVEKSA